jgi:TPR repeat protein
MVNLGTIFLNGIPGIAERNYNKACEYFTEAMRLNNSDAQIHLSYMIKNGLGVEVNRDMAKNLL